MTKLIYYQGQPGEVKQVIIDQAPLEQIIETVKGLNGDDLRLVHVVNSKNDLLYIEAGGGETDRLRIQWQPSMRADLSKQLSDPEYAESSELITLSGLHGDDMWHIGDTVPKALALKAVEQFCKEQPFSDDLIWEPNKLPLPRPREAVNMWLPDKAYTDAVPFDEITSAIEALHTGELFLEVGGYWYGWGDYFRIIAAKGHPDRVIVACYSPLLEPPEELRLVESTGDETVSKSLAIRAAEYFFRGESLSTDFNWRPSPPGTAMQGKEYSSKA